MAFLTFEDIQAERNIDLTDPNGQDITTSLIAAATTYIETIVGYKLEQTEDQVAYFEDGYHHMWLPTKAPVTAVVLRTWNNVDSDYDVINSSDYRWSATGEISTRLFLPSGFEAVRVTYTAGWTAETLPRDLREALIDMVTLKLQAVNNFSSSATGTTDEEAEETTTSGPLKKFSAGSYSEEYSTAESDAYWKAKTAQMSRSIGDGLPGSIQEVVASYRRPFAI